MRLQDTLTGTLVELPPPPEPIGIYVCGPTVYQRAHIGNARPFVVFTWLAHWLREQGHVVFLCVHPNEPFHLEILREACERFLFVRSGRLTEFADFDKLTRDAAVREYLGALAAEVT